MLAYGMACSPALVGACSCGSGRCIERASHSNLLGLLVSSRRPPTKTPGDQESPSTFGLSLRRMRSQNGGATLLPAWRRVSREVEPHWGAYVPALCGSLGLPLLGPLPVSMLRTSLNADHPLVAKPASFSRVASPPQSSFISTPAQSLSALSPTCPGLFPHRGITEDIQLCIGAQPMACSALRLSQPLDGFLRLRLRGLIPSRGHVQGLLSRGFSLRAATFPRREEIPPCRLSEGCCRLAPDPQSTPRGFEAFLRAKMRSSGTGFSRSFGRSPLQFSPPPGSPFLP